MPAGPCTSHDEDKINGLAGESCGVKTPNTTSHSCDTRDNMDPFSATLGVVALTSTVLAATAKVDTFHSNYQNVDKDSYHIQGKNKDKLRWAVFGGKQKAQDKIARLKEIESSAMFTLLLTALSKCGEISNAVNTLTKKVSERDKKLALYEEQLGLLEACIREQEQNDISKRSFKQKTAADCWSWILSLGISLQLVTLYGDFYSIYVIFFRWPMFFNIVLISRIRIMQGWPSGLYFKLRLRNEIPSDSVIIRACEENDLDCLRKLLCESRAHVNDVTSDNLTLLRFAIRAGHVEVVKLLLDNGADPNQTFGEMETSPLNNAFLTGRADIVRLLLRSNFNADLNYINIRAWTNICGEQFDCWNTADLEGWAPIHRAAAHGKKEYINKLFNMNAIDRCATPLTKLGWSPLQCAVVFGNTSTFECLVEVAKGRGIPFRALATNDKRGWTLLHLAAASGSEELMTLLLSKSLDPDALTDAATSALPKALHYKSLKPRDIAEYYGYVTKYDNALRASQTPQRQ